MSNHSLPASLPSFNYLDDPNPLDAPKRVNPHKYRSTKAFFSRILSNDQKLQDLKIVADHSDKEQQKYPKNLTRQLHSEKERDTPNHSKGITTATDYNSYTKKRILSPWCEDDPESLKRLRKRIKSAPVLLNCPASQHKPRYRLSRSNTALTILKEFDQERSTVTSRNGKRFKTKPMTDRYIAAYMHHQETANRAKRDQHVLNDHNAPPNRPKVLNDNDQTAGGEMVISSKHVPIVARSPCTISGRCSEILETPPQHVQTRSHDKEASVAVTKLSNTSRRLSGPKHYSPAGYLDTTGKYTHKQSSINGKSFTLPTLLINDVYKGRHYSET